MSSRLTDDIRTLLQELIVKISDFDVDSENFRLSESFAHSHVNSYHYFFNDNRREVEKRIDGLVEKFQFHGYVNQGDDLKKCCTKFLDGSIDHDDLKIKLGIVQLLLELSESPTTYFGEHPEALKIRFKDFDDEIDWKAVLSETKVPLKETYRESTTDEEWSEDELTTETGSSLEKALNIPEEKIINTQDEILNTDLEISELISQPSEHPSPKPIEDPRAFILSEATKAINELKSTVQHSWWNNEKVSARPESGLDCAEVALRWDEFINHSTIGLFSQSTNVVSEYKIMREVIWEFFFPNACFSYDLKDDTIKTKENTSIASVRPDAFKNFLQLFVPYVTKLQTFKDFESSILGEYFTPSVPDTYRSYNCALREILKPVYDKVIEIEDVIRKQEKIYTLLSLVHDITPYFEKIEVLHKIHEDLMIEFSEVDDSFTSTTYLLSRLYYGLLNSVSKTEQNIYLTLYLQSLYKYFTIIEIWLTQDLLEDYSDEFVIIDVSKSSMLDSSKIKFEFVVRELEEFSKNDGMLAIISTVVLQLGKNIHLLRQLGKLHLIINEKDENYETLHEEYCRIVIEEIYKYLNTIDVNTSQTQGVDLVNPNIYTVQDQIGATQLDANRDPSTNQNQIDSNTHSNQFVDLFPINSDIIPQKDSEKIFMDETEKENQYSGSTSEEYLTASSGSFDLHNIRICPETPKSKTGMDDLTKLLDTSDGFLMSVFEKYMYQEKPKEEETKQTLYEKIDKNIDRIVPVWQILENAFKYVLKRRYSIPGLMVKNLLISQYNLNKYFSLIRRLYLFEEDIIFPFYKKMFAQFESQQPWGNFFWLTSKLHDLLMDQYPELYESSRVDVSQNWRLCKNPLDAWNLISIHFKIEWPVNLIIQEPHMSKYNELFQFILKIKWALYTLNGLNFEDIESRAVKFKNYTLFMQKRIRRLQLMRFRLINDISSVHHYILGHLFSTVRKLFDNGLEEAYDLDSLITTHDRFVRHIYTFCQKLRDNDKETHGFTKVLHLVLELQSMWNNIHDFSNDVLKNCEREYLCCNKYLRPIIEVDVLF